MGNYNACMRRSYEDEEEYAKQKPRNEPENRKKVREIRQNPYVEEPVWSSAPIRVLKDVVVMSGRTWIEDKYTLGREFGRGEFGITYLCTDREMREARAFKSISRRKLRTFVDVEDVRREVRADLSVSYQESCDREGLRKIISFMCLFS